MEDTTGTISLGTARPGTTHLGTISLRMDTTTADQCLGGTNPSQNQQSLVVGVDLTAVGAS